MGLQLKKANEDYKLLKAKLIRLAAELKKEYNDVQQLEEGGMTALFYSFLGNKVEKLDKEKQEYLSVKLKHENCKNELEQLEKEIEKIKTELAELGEPEIIYKELLDTKRQQIREKKDNKFMKFEELLEMQFSHKKEINEAIHAGEMALQGLRRAIQALRKAKNWGTFDVLGGGFLATAVKHSNLDDAREIIQTTQVWLNKFKRELSDVHIADFSELSVQMDSFSTFADYFFDNLIFDWVVQSKINRSLDGCESVNHQVSEIVTQLRIADVEITQKYRGTKTDFIAYIEKKAV